jgi:hypothetical protein
MKTFIIMSAVAFALPVLAAPAPTGTYPPGVTPIANPYDQCQFTYNYCIASGTPDAICTCDLTACLGEDAARIRDACARQTAGLHRATPTPNPNAYNCKDADNDCRKSGPGGSSNQAECSARNAECKKACEIIHNDCLGGPDANQATCSALYADCLGENPYDNNRPAVFGGIAIHSGLSIHDSSINAADRRFWILRQTTTACPKGFDSICSNTTSTQFTGGDNTLSLDTFIPAQQVYVAVDGTLKYTAPHSLDVEDGSFITGFSFAQNDQHIQFQGQDFLACPSGGAFVVYAAAIAKDASGCDGFAFRVVNSSLPAAWEYA